MCADNAGLVLWYGLFICAPFGLVKSWVLFRSISFRAAHLGMYVTSV